MTSRSATESANRSTTGGGAIIYCCLTILRDDPTDAVLICMTRVKPEYNANLRSDEMHAIDMTALTQLLTQRGDAVWIGLNAYCRTCPINGGTFKYLCQLISQSQQTSMLGHYQTSMCPRRACSSLSGSGWVVIACPRMRALWSGRCTAPGLPKTPINFRHKLDAVDNHY